MSTINRIREILGEHAPAHLDYATESPDGVVIPLNPNRTTGWNKFYAERALGEALAPLVEKGWTVTTGPINFRKRAPEVLIVRPPASDGIDTATLPLRDRIRVEGKAKRRSGTDFVDRLEINEETGQVTFNSAGAGSYEARLIEQLVTDLRQAGWTGPVGRQFGRPGIYGTLTAPEHGLTVKPARINAFTAA